jgi:hypothetical protein
MALGHGLRGEQVLARHGRQGYSIVWNPENRPHKGALSEPLCSFCLELPITEGVRHVCEEAAMDIGAPDTEHEIEISPLEEPVPAPAPVEEPAREPVPA